MDVELIKDKSLDRDRIDIHYIKMNKKIQRIMSIAKESGDLSAKNQDGCRFCLSPDKILYFESVDKRVFAYLPLEVCEVSENLLDLENSLEDSGFIRINKSHVVNIYQIASIKPEINMRIKAVMSNGEALMINRSYKKSFMNFLESRRNI